MQFLEAVVEIRTLPFIIPYFQMQFLSTVSGLLAVGTVLIVSVRVRILSFEDFLRIRLYRGVVVLVLLHALHDHIQPVLLINQVQVLLL